MSDAPKLEKAKLIPMNGDEPDLDAAITVQFNPESLKVGLSNTLQAENEGGGQTSAAQYVSKSESTLSLTLVFDTSVDSPRSQEERDAAFDDAVDTFLSADQTASEFSDGLKRDSEQAAERLDVRTRTKVIADLFMQPQEPEGQGGSGEERPAPPKRCRFQWGSFAFVGMVSSYDETLDFFSPDGLPLRATLALTLKEDRYQFEQVARPEPAVREQPRFAPGGGSLADAARNAGRDPRDWRDLAIFNGIESPRLAASLSLSAPGVSLSGSASLGGASLAAGGISGRLSAGVSAGIGGSAPAGFGVGASAAASGPAKAAFSVGASSSLGTDVPGAFVSLGGAGATAQAKVAAGLGAGVGGSAPGGGASAGLGVSASAWQASANFDFDTG